MRSERRENNDTSNSSVILAIQEQNTIGKGIFACQYGNTKCLDNAGPNQLFNLFMLPIGHILQNSVISYHSYTDNTQVYGALSHIVSALKILPTGYAKNSYS